MRPIVRRAWTDCNGDHFCSSLHTTEMENTLGGI